MYVDHIITRFLLRSDDKACPGSSFRVLGLLNRLRGLTDQIEGKIGLREHRNIVAFGLGVRPRQAFGPVQANLPHAMSCGRSYTRPIFNMRKMSVTENWLWGLCEVSFSLSASAAI